MNTRPQITSVEPMIRIPAWRSASPKNLNTRRPKISRKTCAMNLTSSPNVSTQPLGVATSSPMRSLRDGGDFGVGGEQCLGERVVEREDPVERDHDRLVDRLPHALSATRRSHPLVTANDRDDRAEHRRLQH